MTRALGRWVVFALAAVYFVGPVLVTLWFTVHAPNQHGIGFGAYREIFTAAPVGQVSFATALVFSVVMSAVTIAFTLALMVPTQVLLHLKMPRMRGVVEVICLLPLVFPPIVLVVGVTSVYGWAQPDDNGDGSPLFRALVWVRDDHHPLLLVLLYAVMALPFVYRTIDAGLRSIDVATLTEASRSLGASWWTTIVGVLVASLRTSLVNAAFLIFALAMGEYTVSSILLYEKPFAVWLVNLPTQSGQVQAAISVLSLVLVEAILLVFAGGIGIGGRTRNDRKAMA